MTDETPFYGIRYPDSTTKVVNLGAELKQFALDFEAALRRETVFGNSVLADLYAVAQAVDGAVTPTDNAMAAAAASPSSQLHQALDNLYGSGAALPEGFDLNDLVQPGHHRVQNPNHAPIADSWLYVHVQTHGSNTAFLRQTAYGYFDPTHVWNRVRVAGTYSAWRQVAFV